MPRYCSTCVQPDTRPGIQLNAAGVCGACLGHIEKERVIDWPARRKSLETILTRFRGINGPHDYDCIVPVSGGKDSTYQAYMLKEVFGMNPLCVTYRTPLRTELGQRNLDNLQRRLKVDLLELSVSPETERRFILKALREVGDCGLPFHQGIFAFALRAAVNQGIALVVWGECSQLEYGGDDLERQNLYLDRAWLAKHGCLQGRTPADWADDELSLAALRPFVVPTEAELQAKGIQSIFLGQFLKWDPVENAEVARGLGFETARGRPPMGIYDFADLDCKLITAHHYLKWFKFGMTRTYDNVSIEIRNGRMTRERGVEWVRKNKDDMIPPEHLDSLCRFLGITEPEFWTIAERFRNPKVWQRDAGGRWYIPDYLFPWPQDW
jgi:N-acetyl sugar amidotransferase